MAGHCIGGRLREVAWLFARDRLGGASAERVGSSRLRGCRGSGEDGELVTKTFKTFLATWQPARGIIRVVIVKEENRCEYFFCTNPDATPREIIEAFADRATIEQDFHDVKEVWGTGQQQVRNIWTNIAVFNLNLWVHTLIECWAWRKDVDSIRDRRDSPWDKAERRPSHADRRKALRRETLGNEYFSLSPSHRKSSRIRDLYALLLQLAA